MSKHLTCSFAKSLATVSWRMTHDVAPRVGANVEVVAQTHGHRDRVLVTTTVRLHVHAARLHVSIDGRHLATTPLVRSPDQAAAGPGRLFVHTMFLPSEVQDGRMHVLGIVVDGSGDDESDDDGDDGACAETQPSGLPVESAESAPEPLFERLAMLTHETAFYARVLLADCRAPS